MKQRFTCDVDGFLDYAGEALFSLRCARDRAAYLREREMGLLIDEAETKVIAAMGRAWTIKSQGHDGDTTL